jgi:hypothetical protein
MRPRTQMYVTLDVHITLLWLLRGWKLKNQEYTKSPQNVMIPNHHKRKHGSKTTKKTVARMWPKNQKLNVEDHIESTPTKHERKPIPRIGS